MRSSTSAVTRRIVSSDRLSTAAWRSTSSALQLGGVLGVGPGQDALGLRDQGLGRLDRLPHAGGKVVLGGPAIRRAGAGRAVGAPRPSRRSPRGDRRRRSAAGSRNRSIALSIVTGAARPVSRSVAVTLRMPLRSRSSRTTIWLPASTPARPSIVNSPTRVLYRVSSFSPWKTRISAASWPSLTVAKISVREAGRGVLRSMIGEKVWTEGTPCSSPSASMPEGVRGDVHEDRADLHAGDQAPLNGRPHRDGQVGLDLGVHRAAEPVLEQAMDQRRPGRAADQDDLVDLVRLQLGVGERLIEAGEGLGQQGLDQRPRTRRARSPSSGGAGRRSSRR